MNRLLVLDVPGHSTDGNPVHAETDDALFAAAHAPGAKVGEIGFCTRPARMNRA
jgi:hypothetical protein